MEAIQMLKERRSVRRYKQEKVDRELMKEIIDISRFAPSWCNYQIARYTVIDDIEVIKRISEEGANDFIYNINTLKNTKGVVVLSFVQGKSGKIKGVDTSTLLEANVWEAFDAGIACQTFCLAAYAKGIGTCIMGVFNEKKIAEIINLPENETVAALITYGYIDEEPKTAPRKDVNDIMRFI